MITNIGPLCRGLAQVVFAHDGQTLTYHYERNPEDPRIGHALVLDVDEYGSAAAMSDGQVEAVYDTDVDGTLLEALGYVADEELWWARSPKQELDPEQFWQPVSVTDPFGGTTEITRDGYALFVTAVQDPVGNVVAVEHDGNATAIEPSRPQQCEDG